MPNRCPFLRPVQLVFVLGVCAGLPACPITWPDGGLLPRAQAGPGSTAPSAASTTTVIRPQSVLEWSVLPNRSFSQRGLRGRSVVSSDGRMKLGPYGSVDVGGLTSAQAKAAVIQHLATYH